MFLSEDRIDETTLNAALFFTVKPSELRILSVLGAGGHANVSWRLAVGVVSHLGDPVLR